MGAGGARRRRGGAGRAGPAALTDAWRRRLGEIAAEHGLEGAAEDALARLLELLRDDPTAPTTVREPRDAVDVQIADSLSALAVPAVRAAQRLADLGSGPGFPGLPLSLSLPSADVALVESTARKCDFLRRAVEAAGAAGAAVVCARAEEWEAPPQDVVCARAVAPLAVLVEYAAPLLREGGTLVAWKGRRDPREEADGAAAADHLGLESVEVIPTRPFAASRHRHLHLYLKVRPTPPGFPRRAGMARKRPLSP